MQSKFSSGTSRGFPAEFVLKGKAKILIGPNELVYYPMETCNVGPEARKHSTVIVCLQVTKNIIYRTAQNFGGQNFCRFRTARKLVKKILAADHANNSSLFEHTRTYNI